VPDEATLLRAIGALDEKLTAVINSGLAALTTAIAHLQAEHAKALLEQERRNAHFADRTSVETLTRTVDRHADQFEAIRQRSEISDKQHHEVVEDLEALQTTITERTYSSLKTGYTILGAAAITLGTPVLVVVAEHLFK
jgi:sulfite reductase beta subunit-like hemoprotein